MERDEALKLLRGGKDGVREWNRRRDEGEEIPELNNSSLNGAKLHFANLKVGSLANALLDAAGQHPTCRMCQRSVDAT